MGTIYRKASGEFNEKIQAALEGYHGHLDDANVKVAAVAVSSDKEDPDEDDRPLKKDGMPVEGLVYKTPPKFRALGVADAYVLYDEAAWEDHDEAERLAAADEYLSFIELRRDKDNAVMTDDGGRPLLTIRPPDYRIQGFYAVANRHDEASPEARGFRGGSVQPMTQHFFRWAESSAATPA